MKLLKSLIKKFLLLLLGSRTQLKPLPKENKDYLFTEIIVADELVHGIKILQGDYENVIYYYGHVKVVPENDLFNLAYQFTVWDSAGHLRDTLVKSQDFKNLLGDILVAIIADENQKGEYASIRANDTEEPDLL